MGYAAEQQPARTERRTQVLVRALGIGEERSSRATIISFVQGFLTMGGLMPTMAPR